MISATNGRRSYWSFFFSPFLRFLFPSLALFCVHSCTRPVLLHSCLAFFFFNWWSTVQSSGLSGSEELAKAVIRKASHCHGNRKLIPPITVAVSFACETAVDLLVWAGEDPNVVGFQGKTALLWLASCVAFDSPNTYKTYAPDGDIDTNAAARELFLRFRSCKNFCCANEFLFLSPDHLLLDSAPNLEPLISHWEINKFENC